MKQDFFQTPKLVFLLFLAIIWQNSNAQKICGSSIDWQYFDKNPEAYRNFVKKQQWTAEKMKLMTHQLQTDKTYEIPVVFHIVLPDPNVVTDATIIEQLRVLNECFAGTNQEIIPDYFKNLRGQTKFVFKLARQTPDGCETTGIDRKASTVQFSSQDRNSIKSLPQGIEQWKSHNSTYLNIWIGNSPDLYGVATWPYDTTGNHLPKLQGVVIAIEALPGSSDLKKNQGKTLAHEVGHFFNLIHIWGDDDGCAQSDFPEVDPNDDDTPNQSISSQGQCYTGIKGDICTPGLPNGTGIMYQNFMDYTNDQCRMMFTKQQAKRMLQSFEFSTRQALVSSDNRALHSPDGIVSFNACNAPVFTGTAFKTVGVSMNGVIWAGTANQGLYQYNNGIWQKWDAYNTVNYQDMKTDRDGGIWIAQSGYTSGSNTAQTGGVLNFPNASFIGYSYFGPTQNGLPSRSARSIFVDTSGYNGPTTLPLVWVATYANNTAGVSSTGGIGRGINPVAPQFNKITTGIDSTLNTGGVFYIGGDANEIWSFATNNYGKSQILRHNAQTNARIYPPYDVSNGLSGLVADQFQARAIYFDVKGNKWIPINGEGLLVQDTSKVWHKINFSEIFTSQPFFNPNAITGDTLGNVFIGTLNGLVVYHGGYQLDDLNSYRRFTTSSGLLSTNILSIAVDTSRKKLVIGTDVGISLWAPACSGENLKKVYYTSSSGDLGNSSTWCFGEAPKPNSEIVVKHPITITTNTTIKKATISSPGSVSVAAGVNYNITGQ